MTAAITFYKMSASGNDFILIDNRKAVIESGQAPALARSLCQRKISVGADGLILIEKDEEVDFCWRFFNADGSSAEMCGNGARCAARLAHLLGICGSQPYFRTLAGIIHAEIIQERVRLELTPPKDLRLEEQLRLAENTVTVHSVNTGVPHTVFILDGLAELKKQDVRRLGREVRLHPRYLPAGTNVNFVAVLNSHAIAIRTYERGVEDETLACGTGSIAAALVASAKGLAHPPVSVQTRSGETLTVHFDASQGETPERVYLEGDARVVYRGELWQETTEIL